MWVANGLPSVLTRHFRIVVTLLGYSHLVFPSVIVVVIVPWRVAGRAGVFILNIISTCMAIVVVFKTLHQIFLARTIVSVQISIATAIMIILFVVRPQLLILLLRWRSVHRGRRCGYGWSHS